MFNDNVEMPIPFQDNTDVKGLKQASFPLSIRDHNAMDKILDPLSDQG